MIDLAKIIIKADGGGVNMGLLAEPPTSTIAHFNLNDTSFAGQKFCPTWIRIHFSGTGATLADVGMYVDSWRGFTYDTLLWTEASKGLNKDVVLRVPEEELMHWMVEPGDDFVLTWTNPHPAAVMWAATVALYAIGV